MIQPDTERLRDLLPFDRLVPALRAAFSVGATVPARHVHQVATGADAGTSLLMPAWDAEGYYGVKIVNIFPGNAARRLPGLHSSYILHDARTGVPLALLDGNEITSRRTAAASALAASFLARPDASRLLVVGAGRVGRLVARRSVRCGRSTSGTGTPAPRSMPPQRWCSRASPPAPSPTWKRPCGAPTSSAAPRSRPPP
jgi:ornithine cyclodeaminase